MLKGQIMSDLYDELKIRTDELRQQEADLINAPVSGLQSSPLFVVGDHAFLNS